MKDLRNCTQRYSEEDTLRFDEPPGWLIPVRHSLGASLMQAGRFAEAEEVYRADLSRSPENGWAAFRARAKPAKAGKERGGSRRGRSAISQSVGQGRHADYKLLSLSAGNLRKKAAAVNRAYSPRIRDPFQQIRTGLRLLLGCAEQRAIIRSTINNQPSWVSSTGSIEQVSTFFGMVHSTFATVV